MIVWGRKERPPFIAALEKSSGSCLKCEKDAIRGRRYEVIAPFRVKKTVERFGFVG